MPHHLYLLSSHQLGLPFRGLGALQQTPFLALYFPFIIQYIIFKIKTTTLKFLFQMETPSLSSSFHPSHQIYTFDPNAHLAIRHLSSTCPKSNLSLHSTLNFLSQLGYGTKQPPTQAKNQGAMSLGFLISIMVTAQPCPKLFWEFGFNAGKAVAPGTLITCTHTSPCLLKLLPVWSVPNYSSSRHSSSQCKQPPKNVRKHTQFQRIAFICCCFGFETGPLVSNLPSSLLCSWGGPWTFTSLLLNSKLDG